MAILYAPHAPYQPSYNPPHIRMSLASNHACVVCDDPELPTSLLPRTLDPFISAPTLTPSCLWGVSDG